MRILVTGANGQLGREFCHIHTDKYQVMGLTREALDITDPAAVYSRFKDYSPDVLINAAAYTNVDGAEAERELAYSVNRDAVKYLSENCKKFATKFIHISTDYIFSGDNNMAYKETDKVSPLNIYGSSKAEGEKEIRDICDEYLILRCSWIFSPYNKNFVKTMIRLASEKEQLKIVNDQYGCPTSARQIAFVISSIITQLEGNYGTYHYAQPEPVSWYDFALAIIGSMKKWGMEVLTKEVLPISTAEYEMVATRPKYSVLDYGKIAEVFSIKPLSWRESLDEVVGELADEKF